MRAHAISGVLFRVVSRSSPLRFGAPRWGLLVGLSLGALAPLGCVGDVGGDEPVGTAVDASCNPGPAPMRRLTRWEYNNTVADLLGDATAPASGFVPEAGQFGFDNAAEGATLSDVVVEQFETASRALAKNAVADLPTLLACDVATQGEDICASTFIASFGRRAFRRPLSDDERARYQALYASSKSLYDFSTAMELLVSGMLQSPHFLYRIEIQNAATSEVASVHSFEMASRLSYFLWGTMPDDVLLDAAESGKLETPEDVQREARRMLEADKGTRAVKNFFGQWARLQDLPLIQRDETLFPPSTPALMREELDRYVEDVFRASGSYRDLLTTPATFVNGELASFYGMEGITGSEWQRVELDPARYPGLLTRGGLLAVQAHPDQPSPVLRGKFLREQIFCDPPPPPPCNADTTLPPIDPNATTREQLEQKTGQQPCVGCHNFLNPPGFAFDHFDQVGKWREDDHGLPIDTSGDLTLTDVNGSFESHVDLIARLPESEQAEQCMVTHWFRYAYGRGTTEADTCTQDDLQTLFAQSGGDLRELMVALTQTRAFLYRAPAQGDGQ